MEASGAQMLALGLANIAIMSVAQYTNKSLPQLNSLEIASISVLAEMAKCALCLLMTRGQKRKNYTYKYLVLGGCSSFQAQGNILLVGKMSAVFFQTLWYSQTLFVFFLSILILKRKYRPVHYLSQLLLFGGLLLAALDSTWEVSPSTPQEKYGAIWRSTKYFGLGLLLRLTGAASYVYFEKEIKRKKIDVWTNALYFSFSTLVVSAAFFAGLVCFCTSRIENLTAILKLAPIKTVEGLFIAYTISKQSALFRTMFYVLGTCILSIPMSLLFGESISGYTVASLVIVLASFVMFSVAKK